MKERRVSDNDNDVGKKVSGWVVLLNRHFIGASATCVYGSCKEIHAGTLDHASLTNLVML